MMRSAFLLVLALALPALAAETVEVKTLRSPVDKSYRKMVKGMDVFAAKHAMAPQAALRYKLLPRKPGSGMDDITLQVAGDEFRMPVALAADHTFTLARYDQALKENAIVTLNRRASTMTWRADIRTPGLPPNVRRLGDLRLECLVGMEAGLVSDYPDSLFGALFKLVQSPQEFCNRREVRYLYFAERPLFAVTLREGDRRETLSIGHLYASAALGEMPDRERRYCDCEALLDRAYELPLGDRSWSDDALVELDYMDASHSGDDPLAGYTEPEARAALGQPKVISFANGYQVWAYLFGPKERPLEQSDLVVLFGPDGMALKSRLRP
jgi:hypothetical protein